MKARIVTMKHVAAAGGRLDPEFYLNTAEASALRDLRIAFARMWPERHDAPCLLPNGVDSTDPRGSLRDNIRGQRSVKARMVSDGFVKP